jgi:hypothetical protein
MSDTPRPFSTGTRPSGTRSHPYAPTTDVSSRGDPHSAWIPRPYGNSTFVIANDLASLWLLPNCYEPVPPWIALAIDEGSKEPVASLTAPAPNAVSGASPDGRALAGARG